MSCGTSAGQIGPDRSLEAVLIVSGDDDYMVDSGQLLHALGTGEWRVNVHWSDVLGRGFHIVGLSAQIGARNRGGGLIVKLVDQGRPWEVVASCWLVGRDGL